MSKTITFKISQAALTALAEVFGVPPARTEPENDVPEDYGEPCWDWVSITERLNHVSQALAPEEIGRSSLARELEEMADWLRQGETPDTPKHMEREIEAETAITPVSARALAKRASKRLASTDDQFAAQQRREAEFKDLLGKSADRVNAARKLLIHAHDKCVSRGGSFSRSVLELINKALNRLDGIGMENTPKPSYTWADIRERFEDLGDPVSGALEGGLIELAEELESIAGWMREQN